MLEHETNGRRTVLLRQPWFHNPAGAKILVTAELEKYLLGRAMAVRVKSEPSKQRTKYGDKAIMESSNK